jgi:hypothetical protein
VTDALPLLLLFLFGQGGNRGRRERPPPYDFKPDRPRGDQPAPLFSSAPTQRAWVPYEPLTPEVIARAEQILHDRNAHQLIENDPTHPGAKVRYLRTTDNPPGHVSVTAWMPNPNAPHLAQV